MILPQDRRLAGKMANLGGRAMVHLLDVSIEAAHRSEPGGHGDVIHGQQGFIDQFLGEVQAAGLSHCHRRRPEVAEK